MTIFGKIVMGLVLLLIGTGVFYGVTSYVEKDSSAIAKDENSQQVTSTTTEELSLLSATTTATGTQSVSVGANGKKIPFADFLRKGGSYTCAVTEITQDVSSVGTVYFHDSLMRVELTTEVSSGPIKTNVIIKNGYTYYWTSTMPGKGYKTKTDQSNTNNTTRATSTTWDSTKIGDYSCESWTPDDTVFDLPKSVTFTLQ
jgi:hypothetical protein